MWHNQWSADACGTEGYDSYCPAYVCDVWLCWIYRRRFHSLKIQLIRRMSLPLRLTVSVIWHDNLRKYFTDPCKHNYFSAIWAENTWNLKITHWDFHYNTCQYSCYLLVNPANDNQKSHENAVLNIWTNHPFYNFYLKESSICWQYFKKTIWTKTKMFEQIFIKILIEENVIENTASKMTAILGRYQHTSVSITCISSKMRLIPQEILNDNSRVVCMVHGWQQANWTKFANFNRPYVDNKDQDLHPNDKCTGDTAMLR